MARYFIIGIAGGSASGKTTIVNRIKRDFGDNIVVINHDSYYKAHDDMSYDERCALNYDHPDAFDTEQMVRDVETLKNGGEVDIPCYDFAIYNPSGQTLHVRPKRVIIVEGILILENRALRNLMDLKVYVDTDADERLMRRIRRDVSDRGRTVESVLSQYAGTVKPMHEQFVEPSKKYADLIIPRGGENKRGIAILEEHLRALLNTEEV